MTIGDARYWPEMMQKLITKLRVYVFQITGSENRENMKNHNILTSFSDFLLQQQADRSLLKRSPKKVRSAV